MIALMRSSIVTATSPQPSRRIHKLAGTAPPPPEWGNLSDVLPTAGVCRLHGGETRRPTAARSQTPPVNPPTGRCREVDLDSGFSGEVFEGSKQTSLPVAAIWLGPIARMFPASSDSKSERGTSCTRFSTSSNFAPDSVSRGSGKGSMRTSWPLRTGLHIASQHPARDLCRIARSDLHKTLGARIAD
jgi:hypothetical protein